MKEQADQIQLAQVGNRVRTLRQAQRITAEALAEGAGITVQYLNELERGKKCMSSLILYKMARTLNCSCDYLMEGQTQVSPLCDAAVRRMQEMIPVEREMMADVLIKASDTLRALGRESGSDTQR